MKPSKLLLLLLAFALMLSCKDEKPIKEKVKLYVLADPGLSYTIYPLVVELSGSNIQTQKNIESLHILEVEYPKGEAQTLTLKIISGTPASQLSIAVAKSMIEIDKNLVAYKAGNTDISLTFVP
jgi:hypothetical protein